MKKILFSMLAIATLSLGFVSCGDDDNGINYTTSAEAGSAGVYNGTWTTISNGTETTYPGTVTLAAAAQAGCTNVTFDCPGASLNKTSIANVWHSNNGYQFVNQVATNGLGTSFSGQINEGGLLKTAFTIEQRVGRQQILVEYTFVGQR